MPEHLAYRVLGTALGFLCGMTAENVGRLAKAGSVGIAAILVLSIGLEGAGHDRRCLEEQINLDV